MSTRLPPILALLAACGAVPAVLVLSGTAQELADGGPAAPIEFRDVTAASGIGMGMAGVFLALQPRQADETPAHADDRTWNLLTNAMVVASVAVGVLAFAAFVLDDLIDRASLFDDLLSFMALTLIYPVFFLLVTLLYGPALFAGWTLLPVGNVHGALPFHHQPPMPLGNWIPRS